MTATTMLDTVHATVENIPATAPKVAGYVTGPPDIRWTTANWDRFSHAGRVRIDQAPGPGVPLKSDVADMEDGAKTLDAALTWIKMREPYGWWSFIYVGHAPDLPVIRRGVSISGLARVQYWLCDPSLSQGQAEDRLDEGDGAVVAVQWATPKSNPHTVVPGTSWTLEHANVDLSVTVPGWFAHSAHGAF